MRHSSPDSSSSSSSNSSSNSGESRTRTKDEDEDERTIGLGVSGQVIPLPNPDTLNPASSARGAESPAPDWTLDVVGDGPEEQRWRMLAHQAGLADRIRWHGRVPRQRVMDILRASHVLVVTSVYDLTSTVVVEALANGVPVVCPDHCGFRDAVTDECGIRFAANDSSAIVRGLAESLNLLWNNEATRHRLARGGLERARSLTWDQKADLLDRMYQCIETARRSS